MCIHLALLFTSVSIESCRLSQATTLCLMLLQLVSTLLHLFATAGRSRLLLNVVSSLSLIFSSSQIASVYSSRYVTDPCNHVCVGVLQEVTSLVAFLMAKQSCRRCSLPFRLTRDPYFRYWLSGKAPHSLLGLPTPWPLVTQLHKVCLPYSILALA